MARLAAGLALTGLFVLGAGMPGARPAVALAPEYALCENSVAAAEETFDIPGQLLMAIALVESGRWNAEQERVVAWPWTVYAEGQGRYFASAAEAIATVQRLQAKGVGNIDVGCMQINLHHHPHAFANLEDAFTPARNVHYAASFLTELFDAKRSWAAAAAFYHSATPQYAKPYRKKVINFWNAERRRVAELKRAEREEELRRRRQEQERLRAERDAKPSIS
jgi:hypothetical protein